MEKFKEIHRKLDDIRDEMYKTRPILTVNEVAVLTGLSKSSIYKLTSSRKIPHYKKGKRLIFDRREILGWLKSNKVSTIDEIKRKASSHISRKK